MYSFMHLFFHSLRHSCKTTPTLPPTRQAPNLASQVGHTETHPMGHSLFLGPVCVWSGRMGLWVCRMGRGTHSSELTGGFFRELATARSPGYSPDGPASEPGRAQEPHGPLGWRGSWEGGLWVLDVGEPGQAVPQPLLTQRYPRRTSLNLPSAWRGPCLSGSTPA